MSSSSQTLPALGDTLGAVIIGTFVSLILYGLALHQAYRYYVNYPHDKLWLKIYVVIVLYWNFLRRPVKHTDAVVNFRISETLCSVLATHSCYYYAVSNFFLPQNLLLVSWSAALLSIVGSITVFVSQSFYVYRVWLIGKRYRILVVIAVALMILELAVCFVAAIKGYQLKTWALFSEWTWLISVHAGASTVSDLIITAVLIYTLKKSRTGVQRTDGMISTLILYAVSTGLVTGLYNIVCVLTSVILPHDLIYLGTVIVGIRLYSNSLLAALNSRRSINDRYAGEIALSDTSPFGVSGRSSNVAVKHTRLTTLPASSTLRTGSSVTASVSGTIDIKGATKLSRLSSDTYPEREATAY